MIETLFEFFLDSLTSKRTDRLPTRFRTDASQLLAQAPSSQSLARFAIDMVATQTESEAVSLYKRISGYHGGSVLDMIK